jgi:hypothetical protein
MPGQDANTSLMAQVYRKNPAPVYPPHEKLKNSFNFHKKQLTRRIIDIPLVEA